MEIQTYLNQLALIGVNMTHSEGVLSNLSATLKTLSRLNPPSSISRLRFPAINGIALDVGVVSIGNAIKEADLSTIKCQHLIVNSSVDCDVTVNMCYDLVVDIYLNETTVNLNLRTGVIRQSQCMSITLVTHGRGHLCITTDGNDTDSRIHTSLSLGTLLTFESDGSGFLTNSRCNKQLTFRGSEKDIDYSLHRILLHYLNNNSDGNWSVNYDGVDAKSIRFMSIEKAYMKAFELKNHRCVIPTYMPLKMANLTHFIHVIEGELTVEGTPCLDRYTLQNHRPKIDLIIKGDVPLLHIDGLRCLGVRSLCIYGNVTTIGVFIPRSNQYHYTINSITIHGSVKELKYNALIQGVASITHMHITGNVETLSVSTLLTKDDIDVTLHVDGDVDNFNDNVMPSSRYSGKGVRTLINGSISKADTLCKIYALETTMDFIQLKCGSVRFVETKPNLRHIHGNIEVLDWNEGLISADSLKLQAGDHIRIGAAFIEEHAIHVANKVDSSHLCVFDIETLWGTFLKLSSDIPPIYLITAENYQPKEPGIWLVAKGTTIKANKQAMKLLKRAKINDVTIIEG